MRTRRWSWGFGARLALAFALLATVTAIVTSGVSAYSTSRQVNADIDRFLETRSLDIAEGRRADDRPGPRQGRDDNPDPPPEAVTPTEIQSLVDSDAEVQVVNEVGDVIVQAGVSIPFDGIDAEFLNKRQPVLLRSIEIDGEEYRLITRHVDGGGAVQVAQSLSSTNALLGEVRSELILVGIIMSAVAALMGWAIAQRTTQPLRRLTRTIEEVAATQDLSTPVSLDRTDEIGRLSEEFESLLTTLEASRDQQRQLIQDAAHELRTPLTSVRANIDFLERARGLDEAERQSTLGSIKSELGELSVVLAEVVELATESRSAASFETIDLATIAEAALAQFEIRSSRPVVRNMAPSPVAGHQPTLVRAAQNLIANADKYSPTGLPITVTVRDSALFVSDHGPGIDPADRDRVFDRFYRSDRDRSAPGSGLGLAIVAKAVSDHHGRVWVRQAPGGGAEVGFTLPSV